MIPGTNPLKSDGFWILARIFVGGILAYAGFTKLLEPSANFEAVLLKYGLFNPQWIPWMARILPWLEWVTGCFLIVGYAPRLAAGCAGLLFLAFLVALTSSRIFLESAGSDCGCFGQKGIRLSLRQVFFLDLLAFAVSLRLGFYDQFPWTVHSFLMKGNPQKADNKETRRKK